MPNDIHIIQKVTCFGSNGEYLLYFIPTCSKSEFQKCLHFVICYDFAIHTYSETIFLSNNSAVDILGNVNNNRISLTGIPTSLFWSLPEKGIKLWFSKHIKKLATYDFFFC